MNKKHLIALALVVCMLVSMVACAAKPAPAPEVNSPAPATSEPAPVVESEEPVATTWGEENKITDGSQTRDELYELAKEEGIVVLYSISSRCVAVKESFEAEYPGVICDAYDISTDELLEKITREYDAGVRNADVIHVKDLDGTLYREKVLPGIFHNYYPDDIVATIDDKSYLTYAMPLYIELTTWFYNTEKYPDGPPINSWWDLTREEWKGKLILSNPVDEKNYKALFSAFMQNPEVFEADYLREFGEPIVLSEGSPTAVHEFFRRFQANDLIYASSSDEVCESVGAAGQSNPPLGFAASSKLRKAASDGWLIAPIDILPSTGIPGQNNLYIVNEAPHPNAAKLLVRWMTGEADGTGEGFTPFNTLGGWPVRNNVVPAEGSTALDQYDVWPFDPAYIYDAILDFEDYWLTLIA